MNANERDSIAFFICMAEESGVSTRQIVSDLSASDKKFEAVYLSWFEHFAAEAEEVVEIDRRMSDKFGDTWPIIKKEKTSDYLQQVVEDIKGV